jgi:hypothetical protein
LKLHEVKYREYITGPNHTHHYLLFEQKFLSFNFEIKFKCPVQNVICNFFLDDRNALIR